MYNATHNTRVPHSTTSEPPYVCSKSLETMIIRGFFCIKLLVKSNTELEAMLGALCCGGDIPIPGLRVLGFRVLPLA